MTGLLILLANLFTVAINIGITWTVIKLYTEVHKKKTIEEIGKPNRRVTEDLLRRDMGD